MSKDRLFKRGHIWWCWGRDAAGKRWRASTCQRDRAAAVIAARELERTNAIAGARKNETLTLEKAIAMKITSLEMSGRSAETIKWHASRGKHLLRLLGRNRKVSELTIVDTTRYVETRLSEGYHRHTIQKEIRTLTESLSVAKTLGQYSGNPGRLRPKELRGAYDPGDMFLESADECSRLISAVAPSRRYHVLAYLQLGLRRSELFRIYPTDVNLVRGDVHVRGTKTEGADRVIPLSPSARAMFETLLPSAEPDRPIFSIWSTGSCIRDLKAACKRAELPPLCFNDLRRTFCSLMWSAGVSPQHCAALMGHKSLDMVTRVYGRLSAKSLQSAVNTLPILSVTKGVTRHGRKTTVGANPAVDLVAENPLFSAENAAGDEGFEPSTFGSGGQVLEHIMERYQLVANDN